MRGRGALSTGVKLMVNAGTAFNGVSNRGTNTHQKLNHRHDGRQERATSSDADSTSRRREDRRIGPTSSFELRRTTDRPS